ncbi:hypothetical protein B7494_g5374 [Chlorociboria aeruginascens]|nr:hypothetical protein B7494_g5374 [Chlorociboria aeruginascens]
MAVLTGAFHLGSVTLFLLENAIAEHHNCKPVLASVPYRWPLALDLLKVQYDAFSGSHTLEDLAPYITIAGTIRLGLWGVTGYITTDPKNIETILSTRFEDYGLGARRIGTLPLLGEGIFSQDGPAWKHSRDIIRRQFARVQMQNLQAFAPHVDTLLSALKQGAKVGEIVDLKPHFFEFTLNTTTMLLFGEPHTSLPKKDRDALRVNFDVAALGVSFRLRLGPLAALYNPADFRKACKVVRDWATFFADKALKYKDEFGDEKASEKYSFIMDLWKEMGDKELVRDQLLHILIAGRDSTAALLTWTFYHIVRNPDILERLVQDISTVPADCVLTRGQVQNLPFLRCCLNETLRLYPTLAMNVRFAKTTTILPRGGGPDGQSPVLIPKGSGVGWSTYHLHRLESIYGPDSKTYRPQRWESGELIKKAGLGSGFVDFNGGPRVCLGKDFALMETSYAMIRILQAFPAIRLPPGVPNEPVGAERQMLQIKGDVIRIHRSAFRIIEPQDFPSVTICKPQIETTQNHQFHRIPDEFHQSRPFLHSYMPGTSKRIPFIHLQNSRGRHTSTPLSRWISHHSPIHQKNAPDVKTSLEAKIEDANTSSEPQQGAMSRRLSQATEDALLEGGRAGRKAVEEAGFSEELKTKLLKRIEAQKFRSENAAAFAQAGLSSSIGRGSRDIASAQSWTGDEATEDTLLRMLDDARKPLKPSLRGSAKIPSPIIDLRLKREPKQRPGQRLANARDKTSLYAISKGTQMSDKERADMKRELKERFTPGARAMPNSIRGLAALANERIEDAIARGQFKNIPRGKAIERDARADNPFLDTTEYIMNKMIQRQDIVPPWIEKQQELVRTANVFRARLRNDWKRHAARTIASRGGTLQDQMRMADRYAQSERIHNPRKRAIEQISVPTSVTSDPVMVKITQEVPSVSSNTPPPVKVMLQTKDANLQMPIPNPTTVAGNPASHATSPTVGSSPIEAKSAVSSEDVQLVDAQPAEALPAPFRLPAWESAELSYLTLAITNLNNLTRSYNLMAPDLAKKPYFSLDRELQSCYAEIAPQLAEAIKERASRSSKVLVEQISHKPGGILEKFGGEKANIYDSKKPLYGFKELWNDLFRA